MKLLTCAWIAKLQIICQFLVSEVFVCMVSIISFTCIWCHQGNAIEYEQLSFESPVNLVVTKQYLNFHLRSLFITFSSDKLTFFVHQLIDLHNKRSCDDVGNTNKLSFV